MENRTVGRRTNKRQRVEDDAEYDLVYRFRILLVPNGTSIDLTLRNSAPEIPLREFILKVQEEYTWARRQSESMKRKGNVDWNSEKLYFQDANDRKMRNRINLVSFKPHKLHLLRLYDGSGGSAGTFENMWDLTPDTDLLSVLPEEYTFETALADLIDNSLQAVWSNGRSERRYISVDIAEDKITIFDTGPGMDDSDENSIVKWGKMGASLHRSSKGLAIGGKPPYLKPFFGMFGYGGPVASMQLGRAAVVSSKTKESKKVFSLHLEREVLLSRSGSEQTWMTDGGIRDPLEEELKKSQGSFTKVEIFEPKIRDLCMDQLPCRLKDIYFPYIQYDEESSSRKTVTPIVFEVNGVDLAEVDGGEVATTNLHSCNGPDFVLQLRFSLGQDNPLTTSPGCRGYQEANARVKCVYFPIIKGKESIEEILEKLEGKKHGIPENFESFSRVSIRRLGRLLPDARWPWLPFMEPRQRKTARATQLLRRCCMRVKCFVETDAGFNPTPSKTDLAHQNPFTIALKNLGNKPLENGKEVNVQIFKDGRRLSPLQLEKEYQDWMQQMHDSFDVEIDSGEDDPVIVLNPTDKEGLGVTSDVLRVHQVVNRKGLLWRHGQKVKILKGACAGFCTNNVYATLEYFIFEGCEGDACGEARIICRPLHVPEKNGCVLEINGGDMRIRDSRSLPISVIDSGKLLAIESSEWDYQLEKQRCKMPSTIDLLNAKDCRELEFDGVLPVDAPSFVSSSTSKRLDQKFIVNDNLEMSMEIKFRDEDKNRREDGHIYSERIAPSSHKGFHGLYIFPLGHKRPQLFKRAGVYTFTFSLISNSKKESSVKSCQKTLTVEASAVVGRWRLSDKQNPQFHISVGSRCPPFSLACYDIHDNQIRFTCVPKVNVKLQTNKGVLHKVDKVKTTLSTNRLNLKVEDIMIKSNELDKIRPSYKATLMICSQDEPFSVSIPCQVIPGSLHRVSLQPSILENQLLPGCFIKELILEMFDAFGNHVKSGSKVQLDADGFCIMDQLGPKREVDDRGCIDVSGVLKVTAGYGKKASISVGFNDKVVFQQEFKTETRELRLASEVPEYCTAGSQLENIVFEVVNSEGIVDGAIHDDENCVQSHMLTLKSDSLNIDDSIRYAFRNGRCSVPVIPLPLNERIFCFVAAHSRHPELCLSHKIPLVQSPKVEHDEYPFPFLDRQLVLFQGTPFHTPVGNMAVSILNYEKELSDGIVRYGMRIGDLEKKLATLDHEKKEIEQNMSTLQASLEPCLLSNVDCLSTKEDMMKRIESRDQSAAAVLCCLSRKFPFEGTHGHFMGDVVGLVALLGTVCTSTLSRIFATYLGEDQMLAVVCRSYAVADALVVYQENGEVECKSALHAEAVALGRSINGQFLAMCLEDIRPYTGDIERNDPQRKLLLPAPTSSSGYTPVGFLGYAVNMITLGRDHLHTRTSAGYGLRETIFYHLFRELQVYKSREHMIEARGCIRHGAISLDGGIMKGYGVISLGYGKPDICFPVVPSETEMHLSGESVETLTKIEELNKMLRLTESYIEKETKALQKVMRKFNKTSEKHRKLMEQTEVEGEEEAPCP